MLLTLLTSGEGNEVVYHCTEVGRLDLDLSRNLDTLCTYSFVGCSFTRGYIVKIA
jgi:hypothetical protein